jgi:hypothetical protein
VQVSFALLYSLLQLVPLSGEFIFGDLVILDQHCVDLLSHCRVLAALEAIFGPKAGAWIVRDINHSRITIRLVNKI